jgi:uncharacterized protein YutE (UPF0331/DUF86 family)
MTPSLINEKVVVFKLETIAKMLSGIGDLPIASEREFSVEDINVAAAESYLRRALEALLDLGRHVLAKGFGIAVPEYAAIGKELGARSVLPKDIADKLMAMAGYRNRLVHGYDEVTPKELYRILTTELTDIKDASEAFKKWIADHPETINRDL